MAKHRFLVVEAKVNRSNRKDVEDLQWLTAKLANLKTPGKKKLVRLQTRLLKEGVIVPATQDRIRGAARDLYRSFPWWKKLHLRFRFYRRCAYVWAHNKWIDVKLWWGAK